ncbi:MAG: SEC-C metal-binding domain-containing protein [Candidatus Electrothrix sp. Rat3]|nr:SEC-C metal-binding domain-containing protein [Candidatus Electrothrix rattekaaiensis]
MAKIQRNHSCPCGSGKKHKHCCLILHQAGHTPSPMQQMKVSLLGEVAKIQQDAAEFKARVYQLGVFIFFSMKNGDAWVLEVTDSDAVQVATQGRPHKPPVTEDKERIVVDWSHNFALQDKCLFMTGYSDGKEREIIAAPTQQINAALRRIMKQYPKELLSKVHIRDEEDVASA